MKDGFSRMQRIVLAVITAGFFASSSFLAVANLGRPAGVSPHFDWPDETANAYFAKRFADTGMLTAPLPVVGNDFIRPRSFNVRDGNLVPASFLGLPVLYGSLIRVVGVAASFFFTPLLAALALLAFASLLRRAIGSRAALLSALLSATHPAWWYFSAYSYLPNIPFVSFLLLALWCAAVAIERKGSTRLGLFALAGVLLGAALQIRTNEALAVAAVAASLLRWNRARLVRRDVAMLLAVATLAFAPVLWHQALTFGGPFVSGYSRFAESGTVSPTEFSGAATSPVAIAFQALTLPYGFHPRVIWFNLSRSFFGLAPWAAYPIVLAAAYWLIDRRREKALTPVAVACALAGVWLVVSYGSWMIADPLVLRLNTIGLSHVRYWLPLVFFGTPFLALALDTLLKRGRERRILTAIFLIVYVFLSARIVFWGAEESVLPVAGRIREYNRAAAVVIAKTEPNAVIVTDRTDKEIFPDRAVTPGFPDEEDGTAAKLRAAACSAPLYAYLPGTAASAFIDADAIAEPRPGYTLWRLHTPCVT